MPSPSKPRPPTPAHGDEIPVEQLTEAPFEPETLTSVTITSGAWRMFSVFGGAVLQFAVSVVLARLLTPSDFGTYGLVIVVVGFVNMLAFLGVGPAIVQRRELTDEHVRSAWTISLIGGLVSAALMVAVAPLLADLVGNAGTTNVFRAISPVFLLVGIRTVSLSLLRRQLRFRALGLVDILSYALGYSVVGISLALMGWGLWSLVAASLCQAALSTILTCALGRHSLRLRFARTAWRQLLGFGGAMTLSGLANYVALNGDNFIVGRVLGPAALGFYARAYNFMNLPFNYLAQILGTVLLPAFSRIQDSRERMARSYIVSIYLVFLFAAPTMMFVFVAAPQIIVGIYGQRWSGAIAPLQILALFGALRATYHLGGPLVQAAGRPWSEFARQLVYASLVVVGGRLGANWGTVGVAWAVGIAITVMNVAMAQLSREVAGFTWKSFSGAHRAGLTAGAAVLGTGAVTRLLLGRTGAPALVSLFVLTAVYITTACLAVALVPRGWAPEGATHAMSVAFDKLPRPLRAVVRRITRLPSAPPRPS